MIHLHKNETSFCVDRKSSLSPKDPIDEKFLRQAALIGQHLQSCAHISDWLVLNNNWVYK